MSNIFITFQKFFLFGHFCCGDYYVELFKAGTSLPQVPIRTIAKWLTFLHKDAVISSPMPKKLARRILFVHKRPESWDLFEENSMEGQKDLKM